jgi:hypothetical protein
MKSAMNITSEEQERFNNNSESHVSQKEDRKPRPSVLTCAAAALRELKHATATKREGATAYL